MLADKGPLTLSRVFLHRVLGWEHSIDSNRSITLNRSTMEGVLIHLTISRSPTTISPCLQGYNFYLGETKNSGLVYIKFGKIMISGELQRRGILA